MSSFVQVGRETHRQWVVLCLVLLLFGCNKSADPTISSTPVATPIVVEGTPSPNQLSPTPRPVIDTNEQRDELLKAVSEAIEETRKDFPGETAVCFVDVESDMKLGFNADQRFESASLMKLVVIAEVFRRIQVGELELDRPLTLQPDQIVGGSGDLKNLEAGTSFPVSVLAEKMITQSDNTATQMLTDFLTKEALNKSIKNLGLTGTTIDRDIYDFAAIDQGLDNYITARDAALLMKQLARDELPGSREIHAILERQQRNDMIGAGFPPDVRVAHKTGELTGIVHDVGVVYAPRGSYVLAVLSDGVTDKELAIESWAKLSEKILKLYQKASPSPTPGH
ncbi:MAG: serine hydrolase [Vulcanimicrobiota bacterium]